MADRSGNAYSGVSSLYNAHLYWTSTADKANNRSLVEFTLYAVHHAIDANVSGSISFYGETYSGSRYIGSDSGSEQETYLCSGSTYVSHSADGTLGDISISGTVTYNLQSASEGWIGTRSCSTSVTFVSIARGASITYAPDFSDTDSPTITYSNPAGETVTTLQACISLTGSQDDISYRDISKTGTSYTFSLTNAERDVLRSAVSSDATTRSVIFYIKTVLGTTTLYSTATKTFSLGESSTAKPTVSLTATASNGTLPSAFDGLYIQGRSKASVTITASGKYNATISSYSTRFVRSNPYTASSFTSDTITTSGDEVPINCTVTDSRGFKNSVSPTIKVYAYTKPSVTPISGQNAVRCYRSDASGNPSSSGTTIWLKAKRKYSSIKPSSTELNPCTLRYRYKLSTTQTWGAWNDLSNLTDDEYNASISSDTFAATNSYDFEIGVIDTVGESTSVAFAIPTDDIPLHLADGGKAVGIGRYASGTDKLCVGWDTEFDENIIANKEIKIYQNGNMMVWITYGTNGGWISVHDASANRKITLWVSTNNVGVVTLNGMPFTGVQSGVVTINETSWTSVTFTKTFAVTPKVVATYNTSDSSTAFGCIKIKDITTTGFSIMMGGNTGGSSVNADWIAVSN